MAQMDETIHQAVRLKIMAALKALPKNEQIEFVRLREIVGATEGNLGAHITTLEKSGYIEVVKDFNGKKPRTRVAMTTAGRRAFQQYVDHLRSILDGDA
ncbi:transcriptional regulator [Paraburkholderia agricolaris]|uniref:Transcriptional regulator n=1 Tax=Paraburkholderia agricolaris TaxID=2152888 RepID=A0ABW9A252_9BURK